MILCDFIAVTLQYWIDDESGFILSVRDTRHYAYLAVKSEADPLFLFQVMKPKRPRAHAKSGSVAGTGVVAMTSLPE